MSNIKSLIEMKLLGIYSFLLEKNFFHLLFLIDLLLPQSEFVIKKRNTIKNYSPTPDLNILLPSFTQEINGLNDSSKKTNKHRIILFIIPDSTEGILKSTIVNLAYSINLVKNTEFIVITRFGEVILSSKKYGKIIDIGELININPDYILFEIHTIFENLGLLSEENLSKLKEFSKSKILGICFDIWREFDLNFISKWDNLVDVFLHMDNVSVTKYNLNNKKMLFWPFAGWVNSVNPKQNKDNIIYFSGNLRPSDRRFILKFIKKISKKLKLVVRINKVDHSQTNGSEPEKIYFNNLNSSRFVIGLAQKSMDVVLIPFRTLEAISLNCTVIQQELEGVSPLSAMFIPHVHYLPFVTLNDIEHILSNISAAKSEYVLMGKTAGKFMNQHYSAEAMWKYLFLKIN